MKKCILLFICLITSISCSIVFAQDQPIKKRPVQFGFIYPVSSNGMQSGDYANAVSINVLGGYSKANTAFELGSIFNMNNTYTKGVQIAGMFNFSHYGNRSVQLAGLGNITCIQRGGVQIGGMFNIAASGQIAFQVSGMANYAKTADGQIAGLFNYAKDAYGQISGFLNIAKRNKGVQIGLINYSDYNDGVSIGLFNIVRHGGKKEFEIAFSDAINTTMSFRFGTDHLYSILSGGITYSHEPCEYAVGIGLGTQINWKKGWANQIEVISYSLTDNEKFKVGMDMLSQLRLTTSKQLAPNFALFAGPVLNLSAADNGRINHVNHYSIWSKKTATNTYKAWIGITGGVRF